MLQLFAHSCHCNILFKTYPDLYPDKGGHIYIPRIFGFKIFGQPGSKYEFEYNYFTGECVNEKHMLKYLEKPKPPPEPVYESDEYVPCEADIEFEKQYGQMIREFNLAVLPAPTSTL